MKKILCLVFAGLGAAASAGAQSLPLACTEVGTQLEYADYDSRGALTGYTQTVVAASESGPDGLIVETRTALLDADRRPVEPDKGGDALQTGRLVVSAEGICLRPDDWLVWFPETIGRLRSNAGATNISYLPSCRLASCFPSWR